MTRSLIFGSLAGIASAVLVLTAASGPLGIMLGYLAPLPLFFAGLTHGVTAVGIAGVVGTLVSAVNGLLAGGVYLVTFAAPVAVVVRQALLARPATEASTGADVSDGLEWYPVGRVVLWLAGWSLGLFGIALLLTADREGGLPSMLQPLLTQFLSAMQQGAGQGADLEVMAKRLALLMPAVFGVSWLVMMTINGTLAQGMAVLLKQNRRPTPLYRSFTLSRSLAVALVAALVAAAVLPGDVAFIGGTVAAILAFPFFLQGLAVVHGLAARASLPGLVLAAFYAALVVAGALVGVLVVILGFIEEWAGFRRRFAGAGTSQEKN
ncbi:DUF2232 domain-containing protein [Ferrovibrio terrae]|uniref:DUF2232 domain-containing protein n=1 Tax=Ferrovibrio terrae TaxID=2594003 RepID=A0A516H4A0_9PROT|nr:DUF2232 domain-containing protein [Ferrovibrio terrae]QDO98440.1 DUF2232 domain-containing protein [Ferrovibrio terrae]